MRLLGPHAEPVEAPAYPPSPSAAFPAKAGIQSVDYRPSETVWVPAFAGKADWGRGRVDMKEIFPHTI